MKVALCAIAKNENLYIREWVEYYKKLGISHIFLYDNNDIDGERFDSVIKDYMDSGFVEVINVRGKPKMNKYKGVILQSLCYTECYNKNYSKFDWMCFFDIDEFLFIEKMSLYEYLNLSKFKNAVTILFNWVNYGDNNLIINDGRPVVERFTNPCKNINWIRSTNQVKSIIRCKTKLNKCCHTHTVVTDSTKVYYSNGVYLPNFRCTTHVYSIDNLPKSPAYIKHYVTKTIHEYLLRYVNRQKRNGKEKFNIDDVANMFFSVNELTEEKKLIIKKFKENNEI